MGQILLVRHGQASWDAEDYDVLSETGWEQSRVLGRSLVARGISVDAVVRGGMRRHRETAEACLSELGFAGEAEVDQGWDEFDHLSVLATLPAPFEGRAPSKEEFQAWFEEATHRWTGASTTPTTGSRSRPSLSGSPPALRRTADRRGDDARRDQRWSDRLGRGHVAPPTTRPSGPRCGTASTRSASTPASPASSPAAAASPWSPSTSTATSTPTPPC